MPPLVSSVDLHGEAGVVAEQVSVGGDFLVTQPVAILRPFREDPSCKDTEGAAIAPTTVVSMVALTVMPNSSDEPLALSFVANHHAWPPAGPVLSY